jgi:hypothetical protein
VRGGTRRARLMIHFFLEKSTRVKNAKVFPSRFTIMPEMTTKEYYQNITKGGSRRYISTAKCVPADNVKKMDGIRDGIEFCTRKTSAVYQKGSSHEYSNDHLIEDSQKLREFTTLVRKYYSDSNADYILTYAKLLQGQIWDDWIDSRLAILRDIDKNHRLFKPR